MSGTVMTPAQRAAGYRNGPLGIDLDAHEARVGGELVRLTATEWRVLEVLVGNAG